eukprot:2647858-Rhodomonas_salina.3
MVAVAVLRQTVSLVPGLITLTFTPGGWQSVTERAPGAESSVPGQGKQTAFEVAPWVVLYVFAGQRIGTAPPSQWCPGGQRIHSTDPNRTTVK